MNFQRLKDLPTSQLVVGLPKFTEPILVDVCEAYQFGKQAKSPFSHKGTRASSVLELVHTDVWTASQASM